MKKITKIFRHGIIAMAVMSMAFAPVAHAALGDLYLETEVVTSPVFTEDFDGPEEWSEIVQFGNSNSYTADQFVGNKSRGAGVYYRASSSAYEILETEHTEDGGTRAAHSAELQIKIPEFFKDKGPGVCTIEVDLKRVGEHNRTLRLQRLDIAATANPDSEGKNAGAAKFVKNEEGFDGNSAMLFSRSEYSVDQYDTYSLNLYHDGTVTEFTNSANEKLFDKYALVLLLTTLGQTQNRYHIDNIRIYWNEQGEISNFANKEIDVKSTVYNNTADGVDAQLITVLYNEANEIKFTDTKDIFAEANAETTSETKVAIPKEADNNWRVCTYLWSADGNIEAFCDENVLFAYLNSNTGLEILSSKYATGLLGWESVLAEPELSLSEDSYGGVYSIKIPAKSTDGIKQDITEVLTSYGTGTYKLSAKVKSDVATTAKMGFISSSQSYSVGTQWQEITYNITATTSTLAGTVSVSNAGDGALFIDDVVITKIN